MSLPRQVNPWTQEVRRAAYVAVKVATARRVACERTFRYFLNSAQANGLTAVEVADAAGIAVAEVYELTDPAVA